MVWSPRRSGGRSADPYSLRRVPTSTDEGAWSAPSRSQADRTLLPSASLNRRIDPLLNAHRSGPGRDRRPLVTGEAVPRIVSTQDVAVVDVPWLCSHTRDIADEKRARGRFSNIADD